MSNTTTPATASADDLVVGTRILYPHEQRNGAPEMRPVTVSATVEYPETRVLYFAEGGYGVVDRCVALTVLVEATR